MLNNKLIDTFRDKVNSDNDFTFFYYHNRNKKNKWNIICSCMDWIDVAVDYINQFEFSKNNINIESMELYSYISSIDIIHESLTQLHRVITNKTQLPFKGKKYIFSNNSFIDDNLCFKEIRTRFGAHPVNININNSSEKLFASWPTKDNSGEYDFKVKLYSPNLEIDDITFGVSFKELNLFLKERYSHLKTLTKELDIQVTNYKKELSDISIPKSKDKIQQLNILKKENKKRFNTHYYNELIDEFIMFYSFNSTNTENDLIINKYRKDWASVISIIYKNLQNLTLDDISYSNQRHPKEIHSEISIFLTLVFDSSYSNLMYEDNIKTIKTFLYDFVKIDINMDITEIASLVKIGLNEYWINTNGQKI